MCSQDTNIVNANAEEGEENNRMLPTPPDSQRSVGLLSGA